MHSVHEEPPAVLTSNMFFLYMLPLIVLDSGYFMPTRPFFENFGTVLWFAVVGTLWNSIGIGISLFGICQIEAFGVQDINLQENLLFASIISAVEPVAVLTVFEDISVHEQLHIVVFGESLFNDAVTVVLYNLFNHVAELHVVEAGDVFLGIARFFVVGLGGMMFGLLFGFVAAFTTRFTGKIINPFRTIPFNFKDQFGLAYCGLRGAVSFALAYTLPDSIGPKKLFITSTIVIIIFTVFIQGITIRPLLKLMNVRKTNRNLETINVGIHKRLMEHTVAGIEDLCGQWSHYYWKDKFMKFNNRFIRKILIRDDRPESSIVALYKKLELQNTMEILDSMTGDISATPSLISLPDERKNASKTRKVLPSDVRNMHELLSKNMYKIRQRTVSYTNKHSLPNDVTAKEILIRRHTSLRRSLRAGSFHRPHVSKASQKFLSLPVGQSLNSRLPPGRFSHAGDGCIEPEIHLSSVSSMFRHPQRSSSRTIPLRPLGSPEEVSSSVKVVDEENEKHRGFRSSHLRSSFTSSAHQPSRSLYRSTRNIINEDGGSEHEEQESPPDPHAWVQDPQNNNSDMQFPLLRRSQWPPQKPQDE
ncbi:Sodium/hydrogen exchanger 2 [Triplophysa tibetana]|uniref:Sodium/hydrogen exchanger 2 n=1 Tax=Triplophysa tibetana TaxID=1572043 RepID=A0A5A9P2H3_9TELE|nr:Sodium/hydrogen exchanger 2 [Triplophysa tibetana]